MVGTGGGLATDGVDGLRAPRGSEGLAHDDLAWIGVPLRPLGVEAASSEGAGAPAASDDAPVGVRGMDGLGGMDGLELGHAVTSGWFSRALRTMEPKTGDH